MSKPTTNKCPPPAALRALLTKLQRYEPDIAHLIRAAAAFVPPPQDSFAGRLYDDILPEIHKFNKAYYHPEYGTIKVRHPYLKNDRRELMLRTMRNIQKSVPRSILGMLRATDTNIPADLNPLAIVDYRLWGVGSIRLSKCLGYMWIAAQMPTVPVYTTLSKTRRRELYQLFHDLRCKYASHVGTYEYVIGDAHSDLDGWKERRGETFLPDPSDCDSD